MIETRHGPTPSPVKITMEEVLTDLAKETGLRIRVLLGKERGRLESTESGGGLCRARGGRNQFNGSSEISATGFEHIVVGTQAIGREAFKGQGLADADGAGGSALGFAKDADLIIK